MEWSILVVYVYRCFDSINIGPASDGRGSWWPRPMLNSTRRDGYLGFGCQFGSCLAARFGDNSRLSNRGRCSLAQGLPMWWFFVIQFIAVLMFSVLLGMSLVCLFPMYVFPVFGCCVAFCLVYGFRRVSLCVVLLSIRVQAYSAIPYIVVGLPVYGWADVRASSGVGGEGVPDA